jgi:hypothetical protein
MFSVDLQMEVVAHLLAHLGLFELLNLVNKKTIYGFPKQGAFWLEKLSTKHMGDG